MRMRWGKYAILILAAFAASSATSAPTRLEQRTAGSEPDPVAQIEAEMTAFGAWLTRATHIELRVQQQLAGLYPALQRAQASGGSPSARAREMRAFIQTALAEMAAADAELGALELPRLEAIPLADDLRPATLVAQIRRLNSDIRAVFTGLLPLLDSPDYGSAEFMGRTRQLYANMALIFESQVVLLRAQQAATQRDDSAWEVLSFEITLVRAAHRIFRVYDPFQPRTDRALPDELVALANELDGNLGEARRKLRADLTRYRAELGDAERLGTAAEIRTLRRVVRVTEITGDYFPFAERLSAALKEGAILLRGQPLSLELLARVFMPLREVRSGFDELALRQARAMAEPN